MQHHKMFTPILKAVHSSHSQHKAKLQVDKLLLDSKLYSVSEINKIPEDLRPENLTTITNGNMTAFFTRHSKLSNHFPCEFSCDGKTFTSVEQCFMYKKAILFDDLQSASTIMKSNDPANIKFLGKVPTLESKFVCTAVYCSDFKVMFS